MSKKTLIIGAGINPKPYSYKMCTSALIAQKYFNNKFKDTK